MDILDTREIDGVEHRVYLEVDNDCESPRNNDSNIGVVVARSDTHTWPVEDGDTIGGSTVADLVDARDFRVVARWLRMFCGATVVLPLYSTGNEGRPSAGTEDEAPTVGDYIGVTFDQPSTLKVTGVPADYVADGLSVDVDEYSVWAVGECYGYVIERATADGGWEDVWMCFGYIGREFAQAEAERAFSDL